MILRMALCAILLAAPANLFAQSALHIVVVKGEDAVNIIQQKTAVAPVVEIRDRNNLPVAGATVTFTIGGNSAAFAGGAQTLTVVTNAAGQAAAAGLSPVASGAVQINVAAAFQGQSAIAAIAQTNVMTAAEAASASTAAAGATGGSTSGATGGAAGGAAGGGGGLSATTIGIVGAAVAGGAVAATQLTGASDGGSKEVAGTFSLELTLNFGPCVRVERYSGQLLLEFDSIDADPVSARATMANGRVDILSTTAGCTTGPQAGQSGTSGMTPTTATGPKSNITFKTTENFPPATNSWSFQGSLSGDTVTGQLRFSVSIDNGALGIVTGSGATTVTLTPH